MLLLQILQNKRDLGWTVPLAYSEFVVFFCLLRDHPYSERSLVVIEHLEHMLVVSLLYSQYPIGQQHLSGPNHAPPARVRCVLRLVNRRHNCFKIFGVGHPHDASECLLESLEVGLGLEGELLSKEEDPAPGGQVGGECVFEPVELVLELEAVLDYLVVNIH
jgi:hypothetical protein